MSSSSASCSSTLAEEDFKNGGLENSFSKFATIWLWAAWFSCSSAVPGFKCLTTLTKIAGTCPPYSKRSHKSLNLQIFENNISKENLNWTCFSFWFVDKLAVTSTAAARTLSWRQGNDSGILQIFKSTHWTLPFWIWMQRK